MERVMLRLNPDEIIYDEEKNTATFAPGSTVRSASYDKYILDLQSLTDVLGGRPTSSVVIIAELGPPQQETYSPAEPGMAQPMGGFQLTTRTGRVVVRVDAK